MRQNEDAVLLTISPIFLIALSMEINEYQHLFLTVRW